MSSQHFPCLEKVKKVVHKSWQGGFTDRNEKRFKIEITAEDISDTIELIGDSMLLTSK